MGCIYMARNKVNGKYYVGKTTGTIRARKAGHLCDSRRRSKTFFHRALAKYGIDAFEWTVLDECDNEKVLNAMERMYIRRLGSKKPGGYNLTDGGEGMVGWIPSQEWRDKKRLQRLGVSCPLAIRVKLSNQRFGKPKSEEAKQKMREAALRRCSDPEFRKAMSERAKVCSKKRERTSSGRFA